MSASAAAMSFVSPPSQPFQLEENVFSFTSGLSHTSPLSPTTYASSSFQAPFDPTLAQKPEGHFPPLASRLGMDILSFHQTSEESFEARLMAGGYTGYGSSNPKPELDPTQLQSQHQPQSQSTDPSAFIPYVPPAPDSASSPAELEEPEPTPEEEKALRKQRRLASFRRGAISQTALRPVEVEGRGRILLDFSPSEGPKGRTTRRKKLRAAQGAAEEEQKAKEKDKGLEWPDQVFPWSLRTQERAEWEARERAEKLRIIERFLEQVSDDEAEEEEEEVLPGAESRHGLRTEHERGDARGWRRWIRHEDMDVEPMALDSRHPAVSSPGAYSSPAPLLPAARVVESSVRRERPHTSPGTASWQKVYANDDQQYSSAIGSFGRRNLA